MPTVIAHQYGERLASLIAEKLPGSVSFIGLGDSSSTAWQVPAEAEVLLINQDSPAVGLHKDMAEPLGWPFNLRWVHLRSTGLDKYPDWLFAVPRVTVTRGGYAVPIAEYVLAALLSFSKQVPAIWAHSAADWRQHKLAGLDGRTLGIIGFGEIGRAIAQRALGFGMSVLGNRRSLGPSSMEGVDLVSLEQLLSCSDHIVVCTPLTAETRGMINDAAFAAMKSGAHIVNVGRGPVIDTQALGRALEGGLAGATLDVTDPEPLPEGHWLYRHPKVRISPHISGSSPETRGRINDFFINNLGRYLAGQDLLGLVDKTLRY